jgi:lysine 6-dehydrogenase
MKVFVLGAGLMGRAAVYDLARAPEVQRILVADFDFARAREIARQFGLGKARALFADACEIAHISKLLRGSDVLINCTQYSWNLHVMRAALAARIDYMDLGGLYHMTRRQFSLDRDFRRIGRIALVGIGGAPGITNVMARDLCDRLAQPESIRIYNAGADQQRYKSPIAYSFSIATILDELTTPPVHFLNGRYTEKPVLSEPEKGTFPTPIGKITLRHSIHSELGTLAESFRGCGVREVFFKINYPPELVSFVRNLVDAGFTSSQPVAVKGCTVVPRDVLLALLRRNVSKEQPKDVEALRVVVTGRPKTASNGQRVSLALEMLAEHTQRPALSAVARDTGFPAAIAAVMRGRGEIPGVGVQAPENVVPPPHFFEELKRRGFRFRRWNFCT